MKCPSCGEQLARTEYESLVISRCGSCCGYLVATRYVEGIKRNQDRTVDELKQEVQGEIQPDNTKQLRCPRCRRPMNKEHLPKHEFHLDHCGECDLVWFDGGELALVQLVFENSPQGREAVELRQRLGEMTAERRAEFEKNLAALPKPKSVLEAIFGEINSFVDQHPRAQW